MERRRPCGDHRRGKGDPLKRKGVEQPFRGRPRHHRHAMVGPTFFGLKRRMAAYRPSAVPSIPASRARKGWSRASTRSTRSARPAPPISSPRAREGWVEVQTRYDDGGISGGGTLGRPGLEALMADIALGLIDIIVAYTVNRLTRSLLSFAQFEHEVSAERVRGTIAA
ncbi:MULTISPECIES: recombinase family protein [unclassified Sphingobium]|uniref:recombinase family protein n=1 Tax=unclassified Sphingobium TaxID=2611147 RepID=UPI0035A5D7C3